MTASNAHREMLEAWNARDFDKMRAQFHPEYTYTGGDGKEIAGGPDVGLGIAKMYAGAFPDGKIEAKRTYAQGDTAITEFIARGTHKGELMGIAPTGRKIEIHVCNIVELRDGKIYREREYMDMLNLMVQLGVVTPPGHAATA